MEITTVTDLFSNYAFPTAVVIILMIFIFIVLRSYKQTVDSQKDDIKSLNDKYHEDYAKVIEVLNNNTNAMNSLKEVVQYFIHKQDKEDDGR